MKGRISHKLSISDLHGRPFGLVQRQSDALGVGGVVRLQKTPSTLNAGNRLGHAVGDSEVRVKRISSFTSLYDAMPA
jgi:hypothetical protein